MSDKNFSNNQYPLMTDNSFDVNVQLYVFCHICNLDIPKLRITEHNDGDKHKMCFKLAKEGFERMNKHLTLADKQSTIDAAIFKLFMSNNGYYCHSCNTTVLNNRRTQHTSSNEHVIAANKDKLFLTMYELYMNNDMSDEIYNATSSKASVKPEDTKVGPTTDAQLVNNNNTKATNNAKMLTVKAKTGKVFKIPEDNFHGIAFGYYCGICPETMLKYEDIQNHKADTGHGQLLHLSSDVDEYGLRKLSSVSSHAVHCVVCNTFIDSSWTSWSDLKDHISKPEHKNNYEKAILNEHNVHLNKNSKIINEVASASNACYGKDSAVIKANTGPANKVKAHDNKINPKFENSHMKINNQQKNTLLIKPVEGSSVIPKCDSKITPLLETSNASARVFEISEDNANFKHDKAPSKSVEVNANKIKAMATIAPVKAIAGGSQMKMKPNTQNLKKMCKPCETKNGVGNKHIENVALQIAKGLIDLVANNSPNAFIFCKVCNVNVPNHPDSVSIHNRGSNHTSNLKKSQKRGK